MILQLTLGSKRLILADLPGARQPAFPLAATATSETVALESMVIRKMFGNMILRLTVGLKRLTSAELRGAMQSEFPSTQRAIWAPVIANSPAKPGISGNTHPRKRRPNVCHHQLALLVGGQAIGRRPMCRVQTTARC